MKRNKCIRYSSIVFSLLLFIFIFFTGGFAGYSQLRFQPGDFAAQPPPPPQNYIANSTAFKQEIARMEINVARGDNALMPLTEVQASER